MSANNDNVNNGEECRGKHFQTRGIRFIQHALRVAPRRIDQRF